MAPPPPELIEELVEEVILRFLPDDPASLMRAALVCKPWCRLVSGTAFRRRFSEVHRGAAPLLGVLYNTGFRDWVRDFTDDDDDDMPSWSDDDDDTDDRRPIKRARILTEPTASFVPTTSYRPADGRRNGWRAIDAHHGRVLLCRQRDPACPRRLALSVWDPVTDEQLDLPDAPLDTLGFSAAVACAAAGGNCCDHLDCHRGPFLVVAIDVQPFVISFSVYSSESGTWSNPTDLMHQAGSPGIMKHTPGVLIGSALYFLVHFSNEIVRFDLATQQVSTTNLPSEYHHLLSEQRSIVLMTGDDGELGFAVANTKCQLELWSMVAGGDGVFVPRRVIDLHKVLPSDALISSSPHVNGFADVGDSRFLFMRTSDGLYSIELNSSHVKKVADRCGDDEDEEVVPYISFYTPTSKYNFASTDDDVRTATMVEAPASCSAEASTDARPTTATVADSEDDALQKIVQRRRPRIQNPRFYGPEWANN